LKLNDVSLERFGKTMLKDFSYDFNKGDRIGIVGPNGVGKSTFLQLIMGIIEPSSGTINLGERSVFCVDFEKNAILCFGPFLNNRSSTN